MPLEAALLGRRSIAIDVAPDAVIATSAKTNPPSFRKVKSFLDSLRLGQMDAYRVDPDVKVFFSKKTLPQILRFRKSLLKSLKNGGRQRRHLANFVLGVFLGILHGHSKVSLSISCSHSFGMAPNYVRKYARKHKLRRPDRQVKECLKERAAELLKGKKVSRRGCAYVWSAEKLSKLRGHRLLSAVDLIVTSPPYLNMQTYAKDSWLRLWLLGHDYREIKSRFIETGSPRVYRDKMKRCLEEIIKVLKPSGRAVLIAGDAPYTVKERKRFFKTAEELAAVASKLLVNGHKFIVETKMTDGIPAHARYYAAVHKDGKIANGAKRKGVRLERIVVLRKVKGSARGRRRTGPGQAI